MPRPRHPFTQWFIDASPAVRSSVARKAKTSVESLRQLAFGYRSAGTPVASPEYAARIEAATGIHRSTLSPVCTKCPHAK